MRTIAHISDLHFGRIDPRVVEALATELSERKPNLVVVSGDLTQRGRAGQYTAAAEFLKRLPRPQLVVPGNHDIPLYDVVRRFFFPLDRYARHITADFSPMYRDDELLVIGINTARSFTFRLAGFWKDGRIAEEQLQQVLRQACDVPENIFKIVVTHHPFIPPNAQLRNDIVHGAAAALETMKQCGIDLLLAGHLHMGYSGDVQTHHEAVQHSILSVQAGTATSTRHRNEPNAYNWITVQRDQVQIEVRAWDGNRFSASNVTQFNRSNGIWQKGTS